MLGAARAVLRVAGSFVARVLLCSTLLCLACSSTENGDGGGGGGGTLELDFMWGLSAPPWDSIEGYYRWDTSPPADKAERLARDLQQIGAAWYRPHVSWRRVEPVVSSVSLRVEDVTEQQVEHYAFADASKDWSASDLVIDALVDGGIGVMAVVNGAYLTNLPDYEPTPGSPELLLPDRVGADDYLGLVYLHTRAVVRRYRDRVRFWQIENELNVACETILFGWRQGELWCDPGFRTRVMATLNQAVKTEDPEALTTHNFHTQIHWIEDVLEWAPHLDIIGLDAFPNYTSGDTPHGEYIVERVEEAVALGLNRPVMVLETGYPTAPADKGFSEEGQVTYMTDAAAPSYEAGASGFFFFTLVTPETAEPGPQDVEVYFGLIRSDDTHKLAWDTYSQVIQQYR